MKKLFAVIALLFCMPLLYSQATLSICTYVDQAGYCAFDNNKFITSPDSTTGKIFLKVKGTDYLGTKLTYKIYRVEKDLKETQIESIDQNLQSDWLMAWYPYVFATDNKYAVKIYNDANLVICSKSFELVRGK